MSDTPVPLPSARLLSRATQQLTALADPARLAVLAAADRLAGDQPCTLGELAADQGQDLRTLTRHTAALEAVGLLVVREHRVRADLAALAATADALVATLPLEALLAAEPELSRWFRHGRLVALPVTGRPVERSRVAALLVRLLPPDRGLEEAAVNALLGEVVDDVAEVRRCLVVEGLLTREAGRDYRRVG